MAWIIIPNWEKFQHYGDRRSPPWIKLYLALLHDDAFQDLSTADRSALIHLWLLYAMTGRKVREDTAKLTRATGQRFTKGTLERLNRAGFIALSASAPLALDVDVEKRREEKKDLLADLTPQNHDSEPSRDPDALAKMQELAARIGRAV
jgi:hypothetical protein